MTTTSTAAATLATLMLVVSPTVAAGAQPALMQAIRYDEYGTSKVLQLVSVPRPVPGEHQVLIEVQAAAINPLDWHYMRGTPYLMRFDAGLLEPEDPKLGVDVAGRVVAVGSQVTRFKPGDEVFGTAPGSLAQFALATDTKLAHKPAELSFEQAAAVPVAALTALQGLRDKGRAKPGDSVLINGASGGVGTFAVQIAKAMGLRVTGVCSERNVARVRSLGAERVIDYTHEDFTRDGRQYDVVIDLVGNRGLLEVRRALKPQGRYVLIGGGGPNDGRWIGPMGKVLHGMLLDRFVDQEFSMLLAKIDAGDLEQLAGLMREGKVVPVIDRRYPLAEVPAAIDYLERGRARGKVIIEVAGTNR